MATLILGLAILIHPAQMKAIDVEAGFEGGGIAEGSITKEVRNITINDGLGSGSIKWTHFFRVFCGVSTEKWT
ncbi:hypothetical protein [Enterococcus sp. AZ196]|uniref:hypothetical protein n=1 Tax=Enterococcus sp. AZ196 TaxID=2774659 RepID=UPI003D27AF42